MEKGGKISRVSRGRRYFYDHGLGVIFKRVIFIYECMNLCFFVRFFVKDTDLRRKNVTSP